MTKQRKLTRDEVNAYKGAAGQIKKLTNEDTPMKIVLLRLTGMLEGRWSPDLIAVDEIGSAKQLTIEERLTELEKSNECIVKTLKVIEEKLVLKSRRDWDRW